MKTIKWIKWIVAQLRRRLTLYRKCQPPPAPRRRRCRKPKYRRIIFRC